ncbi:MAG TPA: type II toxin-antitoxin system RelE/ParE family toxin [Rhabdochlamydiaceae bacterium]|nr:type II toxin-antitoxin system RelE/ParE family toxin [Rhabdochlamydiaceae bacterium]
MKRIIWMGRSRSDLKEFPDRVQRAVGHALWGVQKGEVPPTSKLLKSFGNAKVWEIRENASSGTYRVVYTVEFKNLVAVLHVFQKKSKSGIATPKYEIELVKQRLADAKALYKQFHEE